MNRKKFISIFLTIFFIFSFSGVAQASENTKFDELTAQKDAIGELGEVLTRTAEYTEYRITDKDTIRAILSKDGIEIPKDAEVKEIITVIPVVKDYYEAIPSPKYNDWHIENVVDAGSTWYYPSEVLHTTTGGPGGTITQTVSQSIDATYEAEGGITARDVSVAVGFSVTESFSISDSYSRTLGDTESGMIKSWTYYNKKTFDIYVDLSMPNIYVGPGHAMRPCGVRFVYYVI